MMVQDLTVRGHPVSVLLGRTGLTVPWVELKARLARSLDDDAGEGECIDHLLAHLLDTGLECPIICAGLSTIGLRFVKGAAFGPAMVHDAQGLRVFNFDVIRPCEGVGMHRGVASCSAGDADIVSVMARSATLAEMCAADIAEAVDYDDTSPGLSEAERVWDALSLGARRAHELKSDGDIIAAVLAVKGRGRIIGPLTGARLIRFGVSEWR